MVPCPDALVVLLGAISLKQLWLGLFVLLAFSSGLAFVLMLVGILMVKASHLFVKRYPSTVTIRRITELSYLAIVFMGLFLAYQALRSGGII
jgi:ABC-type nickel/cobalt efflux system permease component RcnA